MGRDPRRTGNAQPPPHRRAPGHRPSPKEPTSACPSDGCRTLRPRAIHKARTASALYGKGAHGLLPIHDCEEGEQRELQLQRPNPPPPGEGQEDLCASTNSPSVGASRLKASPPAAGTVIGKVRARILCARHWALLASRLAKPKRDRDTAAAPDAPSSRNKFKSISGPWNPTHPFTLTQRPKVTEEAPAPSGRVKGPRNRPFPHRHGVR